MNNQGTILIDSLMAMILIICISGVITIIVANYNIEMQKVNNKINEEQNELKE